VLADSLSPDPPGRQAIDAAIRRPWQIVTGTHSTRSVMKWQREGVDADRRRHDEAAWPERPFQGKSVW
jgi:hypothetical protein